MTIDKNADQPGSGTTGKVSNGAAAPSSPELQRFERDTTQKLEQCWA